MKKLSEYFNLLDHLHSTVGLRQINIFKTRNRFSLTALNENCLNYFVEMLTKEESIQVIVYEHISRYQNLTSEWKARFKEEFEELGIKAKETKESLLLPNKSQVFFRSYTYQDYMTGLVGYNPHGIFMPSFIPPEAGEKMLIERILVSLMIRKGQLIITKDIGFKEKRKTDELIEVII